jgi:hypothetical protein
MLNPGRLQEIAEQIPNTRVQIVAVQEVRWKGYGHLKAKVLPTVLICKDVNAKIFSDKIQVLQRWRGYLFGPIK